MANIRVTETSFYVVSAVGCGTRTGQLKEPSRTTQTARHGIGFLKNELQADEVGSITEGEAGIGQALDTLKDLKGQAWWVKWLQWRVVGVCGHQRLLAGPGRELTGHQMALGCERT